MSKNIQMNYLNSDGSYEELYPENGCLPLTGGTMNGPINFYSNEIGANATINGISLGLNITNQYNTGEIRFISKPQNSSDNTVVNLKIGGTPLTTSGTNGVPEFVNINTQSVFNARSIIKQVANPVDAQDAVTKNYVDSILGNGALTYEFIKTYGSSGKTTVASSLSKVIAAFGYSSGDDKIYYLYFTAINNNSKAIGYILSASSPSELIMVEAGLLDPNKGLELDNILINKTIYILFIGIKWEFHYKITEFKQYFSIEILDEYLFKFVAKMDSTEIKLWNS